MTNDKPTAVMSVTNESELLPCPFCGSDQLFTAPDNAHVGCKMCLGHATRGLEADAITTWNTRTPASEAVPAQRLQAAEAPGVQCSGCEGAGCELCGQSGRIFALSTPSLDAEASEVERLRGEAEAKTQRIVSALREIMVYVNRGHIEGDCSFCVEALEEGEQALAAYLSHAEEGGA